MRHRLNKSQRVALLVALAFILYLCGVYITTRGWQSPGGWFAYAPNTGVVFSESGGMSAGSALAVWVALALGWLAFALWLLAEWSPSPDDSAGSG